tara:strand:- start:109 stop:237 length:129 start_codon:yes stop_codon:yes gene_type:complete
MADMALSDAIVDVLVPILGLWVVLLIVFYFITMIRNVMDDWI